MKRIISAIVASAFIAYFIAVLPTWSGVSCALPFNLTNGTTADASQVMANYNALASCMLNNLAESGANSSITSLSGLTTPLSLAQGGTPVFTGGTSAGTNAITTTASAASFSLTAGFKIVFVAGGSNTAATTLNVSATGVKNLFRQTPAGAVAMAGGEIVAGMLVEAVYDGTQYQMVSNLALQKIPGEVFDYAGAAGCPVGSLLANGGSFVTATFPALNTVLGTTWGVAGTLPDLRGRAAFGADSGGSGRITAAGGNFDGTAVGGTGGQQNKIVAQANLAAFSLSVTDPGHQHGVQAGNASFTSNPNGVLPGSGGATTIYSNTTNSFMLGGAHGAAGGMITLEPTGITVASGGSSTPLPTLSNAAIVLKCVKA
jgi:hypothetical protein